MNITVTIADLITFALMFGFGVSPFIAIPLVAIVHGMCLLGSAVMSQK